MDNNKIELWVIKKFLSGEYKKIPQLLAKFGDTSTFNIVTTNDSVYINGILVVKFGKDVETWSFTMPDTWMDELYNLLNAHESFRMHIGMVSAEKVKQRYLSACKGLELDGINTRPQR